MEDQYGLDVSRTFLVPEEQGWVDPGMSYRMAVQPESKGDAPEFMNAPEGLFYVQGQTEEIFNSYNRLKSFAQQMWQEHGIDVTTPTAEYPELSGYYNTYQKGIADLQFKIDRLKNNQKMFETYMSDAGKEVLAGKSVDYGVNRHGTYFDEQRLGAGFVSNNLKEAEEFNQRIGGKEYQEESGGYNLMLREYNSFRQNLIARMNEAIESGNVEEAARLEKNILAMVKPSKKIFNELENDGAGRRKQYSTTRLEQISNFAAGVSDWEQTLRLKGYEDITRNGDVFSFRIPGSRQVVTLDPRDPNYIDNANIVLNKDLPSDQQVSADDLRGMGNKYNEVSNQIFQNMARRTEESVASEKKSMDDIVLNAAYNPMQKYTGMGEDGKPQYEKSNDNFFDWATGMEDIKGNIFISTARQGGIQIDTDKDGIREARLSDIVDPENPEKGYYVFEYRTQKENKSVTNKVHVPLNNRERIKQIIERNRSKFIKTEEPVVGTIPDQKLDPRTGKSPVQQINELGVDASPEEISRRLNETLGWQNKK